MQHIFIVGSKGIPGAYGGYETFVDKLTEYHRNNKKLKYHVACKANNIGEFEYHNARCFKIKVPNIGSAQAIYYDIAALKNCCEYISKNNIKHPIIYILACRIGPFMTYFQKKIHNFGGKIFINPDGHEWLRKKWSLPIRKYWKISEKMMVKHSDLIVCDSKNIEKYIKRNYKFYSPETFFIAYGAETRKSKLGDDDYKLLEWYKKNEILIGAYYLIVGRFVPENNFEIIIREFMKSKSQKDFVIITTTNYTFFKHLETKLHFKNDKRIKFVGTIYDKELLMKIRENAYGYFHGHEVGGTNPSLLEALGSTKLNLLLDVCFNREVAGDSALYWNKKNGNLSSLIDKADSMNIKDIEVFGEKAKKRILDFYNWNYIAVQYENIFLRQ